MPNQYAWGEARRAALPRAEAALKRLRGARPPADLDAIDRYLIATDHDTPAAEQARALGVHRGTVATWRRRLRLQGRLAPARRAGRPPVTDREVTAVLRLYREGYSAGRIAEMRDASIWRIERILYNLVTPEERDAARRANLYSARGAGEVLGVDGRRLLDWVARGWLPALRRGRAAAGRWHSRADLRALLGVNPMTLARLIGEGLLADAPRQTYGRGIFVWLSDADATAIEGLCAPLRRGQRGGDQAVTMAAVRPRLMAAFGPRSAAYAAD